jgi:hypothetical protein
MAFSSFDRKKGAEGLPAFFAFQAPEPFFHKKLDFFSEIVLFL